VGCGTGVFSLRFASERPDAIIVAVDHSKEIIEYLTLRCGSLYPNIKFVSLDFCRDELALHNFQVVYSSDVLEHVHDVPMFIRNTHSALEPHGSAIINFPNKDDHGVNHFADTRSITDLFNIFSSVEVYDIRISNHHVRAYFALRSLYERLF